MKINLSPLHLVTVSLFTLALLAFALVNQFFPRAVAAQARPNPVHYEYGFLVLGDAESTFTLDHSLVIIRPPTGQGSGGESPSGRFPDRPNFVSKDVWSNQVIGMNALGAQGWEAVTVFNDGRKESILMRRQM